MWPANTFEFIWPVLLKKIRCLCPKDRILVSTGCKFIRTFKRRNSKRRELQMTLVHSCQRKIYMEKHAWTLPSEWPGEEQHHTEWRSQPSSLARDLCFHICPVGASRLLSLPKKTNASITEETQCTAYEAKHNQAVRGLDQPVKWFYRGLRDVSEGQSVYCANTRAWVQTPGSHINAGWTWWPTFILAPRKWRQEQTSQIEWPYSWVLV